MDTAEGWMVENQVADGLTGRQVERARGGCFPSFSAMEPGGDTVPHRCSRQPLAINQATRMMVSCLTAALMVLCCGMGAYSQEYSIPEKDRRGVQIHQLTGHYRLSPPATLEQWLKRAQYLREHILVCAGLWPLPE